MSMTFADQQTLLDVLLGDPNEGSDDAYPTAVRKLFLNRGELQFAKDSKLLREKATLTITSNQSAVPSDWLESIALIVNNRNVLTDREISVQDYERWYSSGSATPAVYMTEESGVRYFNFYGSATTGTLYYIKKPVTSLSGDSDESLFPDEFREASVYWAAGELLQQIGKSTIADRYKTIYTKFVRDAQERATSMYISKQYANPDFNLVDAGETDVVGGGYDFA